MMTFVFRCLDHGEVEHDSRHAPTCFCGVEMERIYVMPHIAAAALPNKKGEVVGKNKKDLRLERDRDAYKRMRRQGVQPRMIDGSSELEGASTQFEIEYGKAFKKEDLPKVKEGLDRAAEIREVAGLKDGQAWQRPSRS